MAFEFNLPDIGEGVSEGEIVNWLVSEGDSVTEDQPIVEVMTDKATVEIASPKNGKIQKLFGQSGDTVLVGKPLVLIDAGEGSKAVDSPKEDKEEKSQHAKAPEKENSGKATSEKSESPKTSSAPTKDTPVAGGQVLAAPITRKTAREMGVDINQIQGSGPHGRITLEDVKGFEGGAQSSKPTSTPKETSKADLLQIPTRVVSDRKEEARIPVKGIRKKIVENMRRSLDHAAHFSHMDEIDCTQLVSARNRLKDEASKYGVKLNYLPFIIKALVEALKQYPRLNSSFDEEAGEIVEKYYYNIGVAVATKDDDLVVPVIQNADQKGLLQIAKEIKELADKAQTNKLAPNDFGGGTFTVTSLGMEAGTYATPIINYPEMGILGFYAIKERPVVRDGQIVIRSMANISFSIDHRIVDGYLGAKFTKTFISFLENPEMMLMF